MSFTAAVDWVDLVAFATSRLAEREEFAMISRVPTSSEEILLNRS